MAEKERAPLQLTLSERSLRVLRKIHPHYKLQLLKVHSEVTTQYSWDKQKALCLKIIAEDISSLCLHGEIE